MAKTPTRAEVDPKYKWAIEKMYATDQAWEEDYKETEQLAKDFASFKGTLGTNAETLKEALDTYYKVEQRVVKLFVYAKQRSDEDTTNNLYQTLSMKAESLMVVLNSASSFLQPEILSLGVEWLEKALDENEGLKFYDRIIKEMIRHNAHTLSPEQETLLAEAAELGNSPSHIYGLFSNADMKFPFIKDEEGNEVELTHGNFVPFEESSDRRVRKDAYEALYGVYGQYKNSIAAMFQANIKKAMFFAKARKYSSTRAFYLDDSNIPEAVYDNLIDTVHKNLSKMHRYVTLRKKMLGVDQLHFYDVYTSLLSDFKKEFTYEQAKEMVNDGLKPMGDEYLQILNEGFNNGWVDVYENVGKRSGAYSFGSYESDPYVLTNFHGTLDNVFTLAHEMGHSIHSYYSRKNQSYAYSDYKIFVAEVASTCNEALLIHDLLKKTEDKKEKAYLLNHFMESFKSTLYRQAMFAEFEMICHRRAEANEVLTAESLCGIYRELNEMYFGPDMVVDDYIALEWARIPHFYTPFYVYQYATGFSAAIALSTKILEEGETAVENYKKFLKGGSSMDPIELLKVAGVDMTSAEPIQKALDVFDDVITQMEEICLK